MARDGEVRVDEHPPRAVELHTERASQRRGLHPRGPDDRVRGDDLVADGHRVRGDGRHRLAETDVHAEPLQVLQCVPGEPVGKGGEELGAGLDQDDPRVSRVDVAKITRQREAGDLGDRARHLDPGRSAADDDEGHQRFAPGRIWLALRLFERRQDAAADVERILQGLQTRRVGRPLVVAEVGVVRAGGEDQVVVREASPVILVEDDLLRRDIDGVDPGQDDVHVRLAAQHRADRLRDVRRRKRGRRHLVEQGLEQVVIAPVDESHLHGRVGERLRRLQPAEPTADDDDPSAGVRIGKDLLPLAPEPGNGIMGVGLGRMRGAISDGSGACR